MASLTSLPEAFFFSKAAFSGEASAVTFRSLYSTATEIACASRLSRARMYIGVGTLFCVTLPAEIR